MEQARPLIQKIRSLRPPELCFDWPYYPSPDRLFALSSRPRSTRLKPITARMAISTSNQNVKIAIDGISSMSRLSA